MEVGYCLAAYGFVELFWGAILGYYLAITGFVTGALLMPVFSRFSLGA